MAARVPERIENDEQYNEVLARIVKGAETLDHPLTTPESREKLMPLYDSLVEVARKYRIGGAAAFGEPVVTEQSPKPQKQQTKVSSWLDD